MCEPMLKVKDIMCKKVITAKEDMSIQQAVHEAGLPLFGQEELQRLSVGQEIGIFPGLAARFRRAFAELQAHRGR